jgi:hypothetical protein
VPRPGSSRGIHRQAPNAQLDKIDGVGVEKPLPSCCASYLFDFMAGCSTAATSLPRSAGSSKLPHPSDGAGAISCEATIGAPRPREMNSGLILLRGCLGCLRVQAATEEVSNVRRVTGRSCQKLRSSMSKLQRLAEEHPQSPWAPVLPPIRSSVAENSKTPNPRPLFLLSSASRLTHCLFPAAVSSLPRRTPF